MGGAPIVIALIIVVLTIVVIVYYRPICAFIGKLKRATVGEDAGYTMPDWDEQEQMHSGQGDGILSPQTSDTLSALGYVGELPWAEVAAASNVDPSIIASHKNFVKDVRRFSSGANFTSVADDNTSPIFTNFVGLRRPNYVPIGSGARQIPDVDENVLKRNKRHIII